MRTFTYAVLGNCQARPLCTAIDLLTNGASQHVGTVITHLAKSSGSITDVETLSKADVVFAQLVNPGYPVAHVVTENLRRELGDKLVSWPNLFFTGNSPGLCYVTSAAGRRILGPLGEYQYRPIFDSWQRGETVDKCLVAVRQGHDPGILIKGVAQSLDELRSREGSLDVKVTDMVQFEWRRSQLFFTYNHPSAHLLLGLARKLLEHLRVPCEMQITPALLGEPLNMFIPPIAPADAWALALEFPTTETSRGRVATIEDSGISLGPLRLYSIRELIESTFACLDSQRAIIQDVRYTPA